MDTKDKIIIFVIIYLVYICIFKERESFGCKGDGILNFLSTKPPCVNHDIGYLKIIREELPQNPFEIFNRIVMWRRCFLLSLIIVLMYHLLIEASFDGIKFLSGVLIGLFFIYFSFNFYKYHLDDQLYNEIMKNYTIIPKV